MQLQKLEQFWCIISDPTFETQNAGMITLAHNPLKPGSQSEFPRSPKLIYIA
jgi:hypothetical protein